MEVPIWNETKLSKIGWHHISFDYELILSSTLKITKRSERWFVVPLFGLTFAVPFDGQCKWFEIELLITVVSYLFCYSKSTHNFKMIIINPIRRAFFFCIFSLWWPKCPYCDVRKWILFFFLLKLFYPHRYQLNNFYSTKLIWFFSVFVWTERFFFQVWIEIIL